jgi:hypothetical protein
MAVTEKRVSARDVPGNKIGSAIIWGLGTFMTYAALDQMSDWSRGSLFMLAIGIQIVLTLGQSPIWKGRGNAIGYTCLAVDSMFNFGGVMAFMVNIDQVGSVRAMAATFFEMDSGMPMPLKGLIALFFAAIIAGLPEYLWKLD